MPQTNKPSLKKTKNAVSATGLMSARFNPEQ